MDTQYYSTVHRRTYEQGYSVSTRIVNACYYCCLPFHRSQTNRQRLLIWSSCFYRPHDGHYCLFYSFEKIDTGNNSEVIMTENKGFDAALKYPLFDSIFNRRTRRIAKGLDEIGAGSLSYKPTSKPEPLGELEEALLIAMTGVTGYTFPDRPFQDHSGEDIMGTPNVYMPGRSAGSPDNVQATHFFLINDEGTYYLKKNLDVENIDFSPSNLIERARASKQKISDERLEYPRKFPYYLDSNRFMSNKPGTTIIVPVLDTTPQYINGMMYLLTQPEGHKPAFLDDKYFYRLAGVKKHVKSGYLNKDIMVPLGLLGTFRADMEVGMLMQNLFLTTQAMGLGGWIHASFGPPFLLGNHPQYADNPEVDGLGLGFRYELPKRRLKNPATWLGAIRKARANPVGLTGIIEGLCPPYHSNMDAAVDALLELKYGEKGAYKDTDYFETIFKADGGKRYLEEVPHYNKQVEIVCKDVCNWIYDTHGRFPAHVDAMFVPGIWLQAHHLDLDYYDHLFKTGKGVGYSQTQKQHEDLWHV
ncbi:MAG: hypothetical protein ABJN69_10850 [Hellea sp.]